MGAKSMWMGLCLCLCLLACGSESNPGSASATDGAVGGNGNSGNGCSGYLGSAQENCSIAVSCVKGKYALACDKAATTGMCTCSKAGVAGQSVPYDATYCSEWANDKRGVILRVSSPCGWGCREQQGFLVCDP